jgi:FkbH-like protein
MKFPDALRVIRHAPTEARPYYVVLACGFTPLYMQRFLHAHLQQRLPDRSVKIATGLYGDLLGTVRGASALEAHMAVIALEWPDLDPRLGYRTLAGWGPADEVDIMQQAEINLASLGEAIEGLSKTIPVVISLPTLPFPPVFHTGSWQIGSTHAALEAGVTQLAAHISKLHSISVISQHRLNSDSPLGNRFELRWELSSGQPYTLSHASKLAEAAARLIAPSPTKKGIITDLDDTFWSGIVGEIGAESVSWDLQNHTQLHGLYQQVLRALAEQGVLVAIASKNDPEIVDLALTREDVIMPKDKIFPIEVHWHAKSASVRRILSAWNISADAVVFVDDSPMELEEVKRAFPQIECLLFPNQADRTAEGFLCQLRDLFAKPRFSTEDQIRRESLRTAAEFVVELAGEGASDDFLRGLRSSITVDKNAASDPRSLELINKTNQFNLNGCRYDAAEWRAADQRPQSFVWSMAYQDKFGRLGKIAVIHGRHELGQGQDNVVWIDAWVLSCRAFARRIEHQCLNLLFEDTGASEIAFCFRATERNGPLKQFLAGFLDVPPEPGVRISREKFIARCPLLFHAIQRSSGEPL